MAQFMTELYDNGFVVELALFVHLVESFGAHSLIQFAPNGIISIERSNFYQS